MTVTQTMLVDIADQDTPELSSNTMRVKKRNGSYEPVDVNKIVNSVALAAKGLNNIDPMTVSKRTIAALADGSTTRELDELSIRTAAGYMVTEPNYSKLAARLLATYISKEVYNQGIRTFTDSIFAGYEAGLISAEVHEFVLQHSHGFDAVIDHDRDHKFEFFGMRVICDRYLMCHPITRQALETPQYFMLRVACGLSTSFDEACEFYSLMSSFWYLPSSPTLFNSGTTHPQMSSCYLLDSPQDNLEDIYKRYTDVAKLSKFAGGIGVAWHRIRASGSLIKGTNGLSNGVVPWLKTLDSSVSAVNQGGRRKGAACVYLETWHADIENYLELKDNTGDHARRTHNLNLANWIPDLFMQRVKEDGVWSLFDPQKVPILVDCYGLEFEKHYTQAEADGLYEKQIPARSLYSRMMRTLSETGNGWMTFKDSCNNKCNQVDPSERSATEMVHLSNLCTEIVEITNATETAVCNLGSVNLGQFVYDLQRSEYNARTVGFDFAKLGSVVQKVVPFLDRVIDANFYPIEEARNSNHRWRPVGLGVMGLQDVFFKLGLPFDSDEAQRMNQEISEHIYFNALWASSELAEQYGSHPGFSQTRLGAGKLQFDLWQTQPVSDLPWDELLARIAAHGVRNSLLIAIAPTATIASIAGCYECIEPQVSNLFKRETLSGEFLQINKYLVSDLQSLGIWDESMISDVKRAEGSIQHIERIPEHLRHVYRTAWEIPQRSLITMAAARGAFIDQSQSLNLFVEVPTLGKLSSMYMYAWEQGLKTTYYLRSRPATRIAQVTSEASSVTQSATEAELACSLENPETCEACD